MLKQHVKKRYLVNLDLENFFPTINFGRVRAIFLARPFLFTEEIATILAQICCFNGTLPQGAPTSPIVSNFICRRLDNNLLSLAMANKTTYSRYADDISFSTNLKEIPAGIASIIDNKIALSEEIIRIIESNGFKINPSKVRYATKRNRQEVTGLVTNEFPNVNRKYVRHVRAMLHAWEKHGIDLAAKEHFQKYNYRNKITNNPVLSYEKELAGKISFIASVRGKDNIIPRRLYSRLKKLAPQVKLSIAQQTIKQFDKPIVFTEGKTDAKHLNAALTKFKKQEHYRNLNIEFAKYPEDKKISNGDLRKYCEVYSQSPLIKNKIICLFDRDDQNILSKITADGVNFRFWGNNVYSVAIPKPSHRDFESICMEHLYLDSEIKTLDKRNRRLFLSDEFDKVTGKHLSEAYECLDLKKLKPNYPAIIDDKVVDANRKSIALSKNNFAENILNGEGDFGKFTFEHFKPVFDIIKQIVET